ncbi:MAG: right-handed parallel beta-helix repeat-containing protein [Candidatus Eisenbacteria bacterium]
MSSRMESANRLRVLATALLPPVLILALLINTASPRILKVPDPFPTIQAGLDSAGVGDTVRVDPGVYYENLVWPPTASVKLFANEEPPPLAVIIDGGFTFAPVITIAVPVDSTTEVRGFVIRNGMAENGAGIHCVGLPSVSSATIRGNRFEDNSATDFGGAICCQASSPRIVGNTFHRNSATYGGGVALIDGSSAAVTGNGIDSCFADQGGGIYATDNPQLTANNISECEATGAAMYLTGAAVVDSNQISSNRGGCAVLCSPSATLDGNAVTGNSDTGIRIVGGSPVIQHNDVAFNRDGIAMSGAGSPMISFNNIHDNFRDGIYIEIGAPIIERNQIMFNQRRGIGACTHSSTIRYNNICFNQQGGFYT